MAAVHEIVPLGNEVTDGTSGGHVRHEVGRVAERDPAIHAARSLLLQFDYREIDVELVPVRNPFGWVTFGICFAINSHEPTWVAHDSAHFLYFKLRSCLMLERVYFNVWLYFRCCRRSVLGSSSGCFFGCQLCQSPLVVARHDLDELRKRIIPRIEDARRDG